MGGSMAVTQGLLDEFGPARDPQHADLGDGDRRQRHRGRDPGHAPGRRDHVRGLPDDLDGAARQPGREAPDDVGRAGVGAAHDQDPGRGRLVAGRPARAAARGLVRPRPRPQGRVRVDAGGRARPALVGDLRRQPRRVLRAPDALPDQGRGARRARGHSARQGSRAPRGHGRHRRRDRPARARGAPGGRGGGEGRHLGRGRRPAHAAAARRGDDPRLGQEDEPVRDRARGRHARWVRRRARGRHPARRLRLARRARRARRARSSLRSRSRRRSSSGRCRTPTTCSRRSAGRSRERRAATWRPRSSSRAWARAWSRARS